MPIELRVLNLIRTVLPAAVPIINYDIQVDWHNPGGRRLSRRTALVDFIEALDAEIFFMFEAIFGAEDVQPNDRVAIRIQFPSDFGRHARARGFFVIRRLRDDPVAALFDLLSDILHSEEALMLALWLINVQIIHIPVGFGKRKIPYGYAALYNKKSRVEIRNNDEL